MISLQKYLWLLILNVYLISPFFHSLGVNNEFVGLYDPVIIWNFVSSVLYFVAVQLLFKKQLYAHIFLLPNYLFVLLDLFMILVFDARLSSGFILISLSNLSNTNEFLDVYSTQIMLSVLLFVIFYTLCLIKIRHIEIESCRKWSLIPFLTLLILYGGVLIKGYLPKKNISAAFMTVAEHDYSTSFGAISQTIVVYNLLSARKFSLDKRGDFKFNAVLTTKSGLPEIYILIIGESSGRNHWSLYGYHRKTTPYLQATENLIVFKDVITEWPLTQKSIPIILSRASASNFSPSYKEKSLISTFKEAGFKTIWLGTQPFDRFAGNIHILASESDEVKFYMRKYDKFLLKPFEKIIDSVDAENEKLLVILHTKGSHFKYKYRYPEKYETYPDSGDIGKKKKIINSYDNTILYTDEFISNVITLVNKKNVISSLLYISDHGENLMEDDRDLFGHNYSNQYDLPVPMIVWFSNKYKQYNHQKIQYAEHNANKKITTANIFYSFLDMANITFDGFDDNMSVFSNKMQEKSRLAYDPRQKKLFNYDHVYGGADQDTRIISNENSER